MVLDFFESKPKVLEALLNKNIQTQSYNSSNIPLNPMGYYSMGGLWARMIPKINLIIFILVTDKTWFM